MLRPIYLFFFQLLGWKVNGSFPPELKKYVVAVAPHTSSWDFPVGLAARSILRMHNTKFLGKSQLFRPPFGWIFRALGGYPVDRSSSHDMVDQVVKIFNDHDQFILGLAPEGTRKKVEKFKTGFYYIAKKANVPVIPVGFDFEKKEVIIGQPFFPTNNIEADLESLYSFYRKVKGKNPELGVN